MSTDRAIHETKHGGRPPRRKRRAVYATATATALLLVAPPSLAASIDDFKAVLLLGFVQLSEWSQLEKTGGDFRACVFESEDFAEKFGRAAEGEFVERRAIRVDSVSAEDATLDCHLLFVPNASTESYRAVVSDASTEPMLIVGERPEFARGMGAIHLYVQDGRLRFEIDRDAAEAGGARLSSRILRRAKLVE